MWNTPDGVRVLTSQEWEVFATGLDMLWDFVENDLQQGITTACTEVDAFESLTPEQKLWTLAYVAEALRESSMPVPPEYAYSDAAVKAVIEVMHGMMQNEIENDEFNDIRRALWQSIDKSDLTYWKQKKMEDLNEDDWEELVHIYEESILQDGDHELAALVIDRSPQQANVLKAMMGIDSNYFTAIPPEPTLKMLDQARSALRRLLQEPNNN